MTREIRSKQTINMDDLGETSSVSQTKLRALGGCRIIAELGHGGMANVYLVVNQGRAGVNKLLVLKALRHELASDPEALSMFLDEARVAVQLNHPNVVQTYEVGIHEGRNVIVMEYLEGQSFSRLLSDSARAGRPLALQHGLRILIAVLEGLHYVHELRGIAGNPLELVHRDISPQNVFVTYDGQVKLLDFGIAKATGSSSQTAIGVVKGKIAYMPPEQMTGALVDRRTDIYAVGCMLWALATGKKLWHGVPDVQVMARVLSGEVPSLAVEKPGCDPRFVRIVDRAMALHPSERYSTALELQADLEAYCDSLGPPVKAKEIGAVVSGVFAPTRARVRGLIESQLASMSQSDPDLCSIQLLDDGPLSGSQNAGPSSRSSPSISLPVVTSRSPVATSLPVTASKVPVELPQDAPRGRRLGPWIGIAAVVAGVSALATFKVFPAGEGPASESTVAAPSVPERMQVVASAALPSIPSASPVTAAAPASTAAAIRFDVVPESARVFLDGVPLPDGARSRTFPLDGTKHTLRAEARGYLARQLDFIATEDAAIELSLTKLGEASAPRRVVPRPPPTPPAPTAQAAAEPAQPAARPPSPDPVTSCSDPFFIGEGGIKRVRPECR